VAWQVQHLRPDESLAVQEKQMNPIFTRAMGVQRLSVVSLRITADAARREIAHAPAKDKSAAEKSKL